MQPHIDMAIVVEGGTEAVFGETKLVRENKYLRGGAMKIYLAEEVTLSTRYSAVVMNAAMPRRAQISKIFPFITMDMASIMMSHSNSEIAAQE